MQRRRTLGAVGLAMAVALVMAVVFSPAASAVSPDPNPWLQKRFLVMAHQGGEDEAPSNTMFALKSSLLDRGADSLELDVNLSSDGQLMVIHDDTWTRIACTDVLCPGPDSSTEQHRPDSEVHDMTAAQLQDLDAGYWFRPGTYSHDYSLPDIRLPLPRHSLRTTRLRRRATAPTDFEIPTLKSVLDTFPGVPINVEIKMIKTLTEDTARDRMLHDNATESLLRRPGRLDSGRRRTRGPAQRRAAVASRDDVIVVSFSDELLAEFHEMDKATQRRAGGGNDGTTKFALSGTIPDPDVAAFQVPPDQFGIQVPEFLLSQRQAHCLGYAVHIWTNGEQDETDAAYQRFYDSGADGVMTSRPEPSQDLDGATGTSPRPMPRDPLTWPIQCPTPAADRSRAHPATGAEGEEEVQEGEEEDGKKSAQDAKKPRKTSARSTRREEEVAARVAAV